MFDTHKKGGGRTTEEDWEGNWTYDRTNKATGGLEGTWEPRLVYKDIARREGELI